MSYFFEIRTGYYTDFVVKDLVSTDPVKRWSEFMKTQEVD